MENNTPKLTDREVLTYARDELKEYLPLSVEAGYKCSTDDLYNLLLKVGVNQTTLQTACQSLKESPHPATVRNYLNEQLQIEAQLRCVTDDELLALARVLKVTTDSLFTAERRSRKTAVSQQPNRSSR